MLAAGLVAAPGVLIAFQMVCRVCTKLSQDVKKKKKKVTGLVCNSVSG